MICHGLVDEGLTIVKAVRDRYDGEKRNPWNEIECGHHYARAMASWSLIPALSGFRYSGPMASIGFSPRISPREFASFFSTGTGWGLFRQSLRNSRQTAELELRDGVLKLSELRLAWAGEKRPARLAVDARLSRARLSAEVSGNRSQIVVRFGQPVTFTAGERLAVTLRG